jgi:hypothetical protein
MGSYGALNVCSMPYVDEGINGWFVRGYSIVCSWLFE